MEEDPCYGNLPQERVEEVFEEAWQTGVKEAQRFMASHCRGDVFSMTKILNNMGISLEFQDVDYVMGRYRYFCEYYPKRRTVCIYQRSVELWAENNDMEYEMALDLILAHEYFHYLETTEIGLVSKHCLVPMIFWRKFTLGRTGVAALSEVAANAFAYEYYMTYQKRT